MRKNKIIRPINSNSIITPNIIRGGKAIDLGNNMYYIAGRKHSNGGVDVGKDLEVEGGEVMQMKPNEVRVFSSVPFLRAGSPAKLVLGGANPDVVFNAQESFKNRNRIKDDGTKYRNGGNKLNNIQYIIDKINNSDKDFAKRLKQNNRQYIKDWEIPGAIATHKLSVGTDKDGNNYIYPEVQNINGGLHDFTNPKYKHNKWDGQISAEERGDTIRINTIQDGLDFTRNYKNLNIYPKFNYGGNMIATINGNVKNGLIHTMRCGGRKKSAYGSYNNMTGIGRASYISKLEDNEIRKTLKLTPNLPNNLVKINTKKEPKVLKGTIRNGKTTTDPIDIFLNEHPTLDKSIEIATDVLGTLLTFGSGMKNIKPVVTKPNIKPKQIESTTKNISYNKPNYPVTVKKQKVNSPYNATKNPKEEIVENINIPEQLKLPDSKALYENAVRVGRKPSTMSKETSRELDKIYNKVVGNKPPRSGFEFKHQQLEMPYTPTTTNIGRNYDATAEWNKYFGKYLYKTYVKKYGKKAVDKALKKENISKYEYGGRKKADLGISYFAPSVFGEKYDKVVDIKPDGTRSERSLIYADAANPSKSYFDILLNGELDNYSALGNFSNRRIQGFRTTQPKPLNVTPITTIDIDNSKFTSASPKTTSTTPKTTSVANTRTVGSNAQPVNSLVKSIVDNTSLAVPYTQPDKISIPEYAKGSYIKPKTTNRFTDWFNNNLDKINLYSNLGGSAIDFISSAIINSKMPTVDLPTMTAPTLANLPEIKLAEIKDLEAPVTVAAAKLKTRYNANPQLAKIEDETRRTMNEIDRNTSSSRVALARKQRAAIQSQETKNQVYGQKENIETELMNKDRLNAQQVAQANAATYNQFLTARAQQAMQKAQLKMMVDRANIDNKLAVDQFNANSKLAVDQFNTNNLIKELLFNNNVRTTQLGNYAAGIGNLFSNIGGSLNNYMINRNARLRDEEVLRVLRARYKEIPQEIMDYILNK
jgi:hypothetical protein